MPTLEQVPPGAVRPHCTLATPLLLGVLCARGDQPVAVISCFTDDSCLLKEDFRKCQKRIESKTSLRWTSAKSKTGSKDTTVTKRRRGQQNICTLSSSDLWPYDDVENLSGVGRSKNPRVDERLFYSLKTFYPENVDVPPCSGTLAAPLSHSASSHAGLTTIITPRICRHTIAWLRSIKVLWWSVCSPQSSSACKDSERHWDRGVWRSIKFTNGCFYRTTNQLKSSKR